ncbi:MAG TPA: hypothetical protein VNS09_13355 [Solirubrobacter sp.]|nr:hypothetical protein [Solirubrobacter sp.]
MSPRLLHLLRAEHPPLRAGDRLDALAAAARMPGHRSPRWTQLV